MYSHHVLPAKSYREKTLLSDLLLFPPHPPHKRLLCQTDRGKLLIALINRSLYTLKDDCLRSSPGLVKAIIMMFQLYISYKGGNVSVNKKFPQNFPSCSNKSESIGLLETQHQFFCLRSNSIRKAMSPYYVNLQI